MRKCLAQRSGIEVHLDFPGQLPPGQRRRDRAVPVPPRRPLHCSSPTPAVPWWMSFCNWIRTSSHVSQTTAGSRSTCRSFLPGKWDGVGSGGGLGFEFGNGCAGRWLADDSFRESPAPRDHHHPLAHSRMSEVGTKRNSAPFSCIPWRKFPLTLKLETTSSEAPGHQQTLSLELRHPHHH